MQKDKHAFRHRNGWGPHGESVRVRKWFSENLTRYTGIADCDVNEFMMDACEMISHTPASDEVSQGKSGTIDAEQFEKWVRKKLVPTFGRYNHGEPNI